MADDRIDAGASGHGAFAIEHVSKRFGRTLAVDDISFNLSPGTICGLLGANGAGKTTTLKMLLGIERPTVGTVRVFGCDPRRHPMQVRQRIGYVPETHHIYQKMRVDRVLAFTARIYDRWDRDECNRITRMLALPLKQTVKSLSRGNLVKLALTIALSHRPELLILDEPTSGLDPIIRRELLDVVMQLVRRQSCAVIFSTHILSDAQKIADRIVVMHGGRVVANDSLDALRGRFVKASMLFREPPNHTFVVPGALRVERSMREWVALFPPMDETEIRQIASGIGAIDCMIRPPELDDVYMQLAESNGSATTGEVKP